MLALLSSIPPAFAARSSRGRLPLRHSRRRLHQTIMIFLATAVLQNQLALLVLQNQLCLHCLRRLVRPEPRGVTFIRMSHLSEYEDGDNNDELFRGKMFGHIMTARCDRANVHFRPQLKSTKCLICQERPVLATFTYIMTTQCDGANVHFWPQLKSTLCLTCHEKLVLATFTYDMKRYKAICDMKRNVI
jgi:hypothetical protein